MSGILRSLRVAAASVSGRTFKSKSSMIGPNPSAADAAADASNSDGFIRKFELIFRNFPAATSLFGGALFGAFSYLHFEIKKLDTKIDTKIDKLSSDILATLDGMHNARYVAAQVAHAIAVRQQPISTTELYELETHFSKEFASQSQQRRADEKVTTTSPAGSSSVSAQSST